jgi:hypothetical protein
MAAKTKKIKGGKEREGVLLRKVKAENQNRILRNFLIGMVVLIILIFLFVYAIKSTKKFAYEGVNFEVVKTGSLVFYNTQVPVIINGERTKYNFYLRNDPRKTGANVPINGEWILTKNLVINSSEDFNCDGDGIIAIANLLNLYKMSGINVIRDDNATCDNLGRYAFIKIQAANETSIEKFGPACYNLNINNCEILKGTERLMIESFIEIKEDNAKK